MRTYSDGQLEAAVKESRSWRGVLRLLGLRATSSSAIRSVRAHADRLDLDHTHIRGGRRWNVEDLEKAVAAAGSWPQVAANLGVSGEQALTTLRGHAARLRQDTAHLDRPESAEDALETLRPDPEHLSRAGSLLAAAWFEMRGCAVSWPLEPCRYDLLVWIRGRAERIQVKTTTYRPGGSWRVQLATSRREVHTYAPDEIDRFFVITATQDLYLIPVARVGGRYAVHLSAYEEYRVPPIFLTG